MLERDGGGTVTPVGSAKNAGKGVQGAPRGQYKLPGANNRLHRGSDFPGLVKVCRCESAGGADGAAQDGWREDAGGDDGCRLPCLGLNLSTSTYYLCDFGQVP